MLDIRLIKSYASQRTHSLWPALILCLCFGYGANASGHQGPKYDNGTILNKNSMPLVLSGTELISSGFNFVEGPVWHPEGYLLFSDIPASKVYRWDEGTGQISISINNSHQSNGLSFDKLGYLVVCEHEARRVTVRDPESFDIIQSISSYQGKKLNSPNDVVIDSLGRIFFTDPPYGIGDQPDMSEDGLGELNGVYLFDQGKLTLLAQHKRPNGLAFSVDGTILYVTDTKENCVYAYDVNFHSGLLSRKRKFINVSHPDGVKVDESGFIYVAALEGVQVFDEFGTYQGLIDVPEQPTNLTFGGQNYDTLFITAQHGVYSVKLRTRGIAPYSRIGR